MLPIIDTNSLKCPLCGNNDNLIDESFLDSDRRIGFDHIKSYDNLTLIKRPGNKFSHKILFLSDQMYNPQLEIDIYLSNYRYFLDFLYDDNTYSIGKILITNRKNPNNFMGHNVTKFTFPLKDFNVDLDINSIINYIDTIINFS